MWAVGQKAVSVAVSGWLSMDGSHCSFVPDWIIIKPHHSSILDDNGRYCCFLTVVSSVIYLFGNCIPFIYTH
jgi:hypothetical protein